MSAHTVSTIGDYRQFGHTSRLFRKTRMQLYDPLAVTQACNYDGYKCEETVASLMQLRVALDQHSEKRIEMREDCTWVAIPVCDEMSRKGSRIRCHARMDSDEDAIMDGRYIMNYCPMKMLGLACLKLTEYVLHRNAKFALIMRSTGCQRQDANDLMLAAGNDGHVSSWAKKHHVPPSRIPEWVSEFAAEMTANRDQLLKSAEYNHVLQSIRNGP